MITDQQVRRLRRLDRQGTAKGTRGSQGRHGRQDRAQVSPPRPAAQRGRRMDRNWRTRPDPFAEVWPQLEEQLQLNPGLEAKTLFADLQRRFPGRFADGQLRTLQRRVKQWRAEQRTGQGGFLRPGASPRSAGAPAISPTAPTWA